MNELNLHDEISQVIEILNISEKIFVNGFLLPKEEIMRTIGKHILELFPNIVSLYESEVSPQQEEYIEFWCGLMERTIEALKGDDQFFLLDVLMHELRGNLIELKEQLNISKKKD